jgi:2-polyprenyl-6-methoxyphenol hydroxylase-like FAD-dependent oxidoreductase
MNDKESVLIVGAGPCGLAVACELKKLGVSVRIIDAEPERMTGSRAIMLWPPAQEVLDGLGLLEDIRSRALVPDGYAYHIGSGAPSRVRIRPGLAPLMLPQDITNGLLEDELTRLGGQVERGVQVTDLTQTEDKVTVTAQRGDGTELTIEADWLIGADGVHSVVRKKLGIGFAGEQYPELLLLAEGKLDGDFDYSAVHVTIREKGVLLAPLPGGEVRISTAIEEDTALTAETVQRLLDERGPGDGLRVKDLSTLTTFTSHERLAESMRSGRCFLVGDAAHMNSVFGGQGLNLGFQDGHNLAWKLAGVIDGRLEPSVLSSYDPERRAAAEQVIKLTRRMSQAPDLSPLARRGRDATLRLLCAAGVLERIQIPMLAGRQIRYPDALFAPAGSAAGSTARERNGRGRGTGRAPAPGSRAPEWVPPADPKSFGRFRLITTGGKIAAVATEADRLVESRPALAVHECIQRPGKESFLLIRPDGFIACTGPAASLGQAGTFLDRLAPAV